MHKRIALVGPFLLSIAACSGGDGIDISGDTPEEAAAEIADAICGHADECGTLSISCTSNENGDPECTATIEESNHEECIAEVEPDVLADFLCADLTPDQEELVNDCINGAFAQGCLSQEEIDAYVDAVERGEEPEPPNVPPSCEQLEAIFDDCEEN